MSNSTQELAEQEIRHLRAERATLQQQLREIAVALGYPQEMADAPCNAIAHYAAGVVKALEEAQKRMEEVQGFGGFTYRVCSRCRYEITNCKCVSK